MIITTTSQKNLNAVLSAGAKITSKKIALRMSASNVV